jgi:hypothetical protein
MIFSNVIVLFIYIKICFDILQQAHKVQFVLFIFKDCKLL